MRVGNFTLMRDGSRKGWDAIHAAVLNDEHSLMEKTDWTRIAYPRTRRSKLEYMVPVLTFIEEHRHASDLDAAEILSRFWPDLRREIGLYVTDELAKRFLDCIPGPQEEPEDDWPEDQPELPF